MTFDPGADIRSGNVSRGSGGGGRIGGRGLAIGGGGGGCVLLIVVIVLALLGVNPLPLLGMDGGADPGQAQQESEPLDERCRTGADANANDDCLVSATIASADAVWSELAPEAQISDFTPPRGIIFSGQTNTGCGAASAAVGPFYCPADSTIYIDTSFYEELTTRFGASDGQLAKEYVIAHEYGHHIQNLQGTMRRIDQGQTGPTSDSVRLELQADCYAGVWVHHATTTDDAHGTPFLQPLTSDDIDAALSAASAVGDDHIQGEVSGGQVNPETWTHGSSEQRRHWFSAGYGSGDPGSCNTFEADEL
ncbi:KPN_02809 family neutral zinc metallopeptidase [Brachybacterium sp. AOP25-B2-12]|uniref:KPN_02809 family neutral zinc metallopeptidase n=1 Tax=Brachybacterium sp. AOP25-B2-12 TaxID=3457710 RepID=UPI0040348BC6